MSSLAQAQQCVDLFNQQELTVQESKTLREESLKYDKKLRSLEARISLYSQLTGSEVGRASVEADAYAKKMKLQLKAGLVNNVVLQISPIYKRFEVDYWLSKTLGQEIYVLSEKIKYAESSEEKSAFEKLVRGKIAQKNMFDRYLGANYFKYLALKNMLLETSKAKVVQQAQYAREALSELESIITNHGAKFDLEFQRISVEEVKAYLEQNNVSQLALLKRAAWEEFWLMLKMMTFSGPVMKMFKQTIYSIPESLKIGAFGVSARALVSEAFQIAYDQHIRDVYLDEIEAVVEVENPVEKYEMMRSLNVKSERPDELLLIFSA